ncbi:MAG: hypothetical protein QM796_02640 [Chthoniobacteraceae bacterium]
MTIDTLNQRSVANGFSAVRSSVAGNREHIVRSTAAGGAVAKLGALGAQSMKYLLISLTLFAVGLQGYAATDDTPHLSPDGRFAIYNLGDTATGENSFEIRTKDGTVICSSRTSGLFAMGTFAWDISWAHDSNFALFRVEHGKWDSTCIFSTADRELRDLTADDADSYTLPLRWAGQRVFSVRISGPWGHHATMDHWHYFKSYRVSAHPFRVECIYTSRMIHEGSYEQAY